MGNVVGVFTDEEVQGLTEEDRAMLRKHIVQQIQTSLEIRNIIHNNPKLVTNDQSIRTVLRREASDLHRRLKPK